MKLGLLITSIGNFGDKKFYNAQEIGFAKELDNLIDQVIVYKLVSKNELSVTEIVEGCKNAVLRTLPSKNFGINGLVDLKQLDKELDVLIYFSDTQLAVPSVYKWAKKNKVKFFPYIGVLKSHSTSRIKRTIMNFLLKRNIRVYRKSHCLVKTPNVEEELNFWGVKNITVAPVGLDLNLVKSNYEDYDIEKLKEKYGYYLKDKIILFIGRLVEEKQPVKMIEIFAELFKKNNNYRLIIVGTGELKESTISSIKIAGLESVIKMFERIPNEEIWKLYRISDAFINLNCQEIFGMAILEAMYYECKVVAWKAPGPNLIIENNISGYLVDSNQEVIDKILDEKDISRASHMRIIEKFTWTNTARFIYKFTKC